jgi:hypothetical protein
MAEATILFNVYGHDHGHEMMHVLHHDVDEYAQLYHLINENERRFLFNRQYRCVVMSMYIRKRNNVRE